MIMKKFLIFIILIITSELYSDPEKFNSYFINASAIAKPSVVNIIVYEKRIKDNKTSLIKVSYGTGTIISKNGFIVTNYHVVKKGDYFKIVCNNGITYDLQPFKNGKYYISEINPRFGGGYPHAWHCNVRFPELIAKNLLGEENEPQIGAYEADMCMMKYSDEIVRKL